jgi:hypothetical protein
VHDTSHFSNNCLQTDYFTYNSLYHNSSGSEVYIQKVDCAFKQFGKFQKMIPENDLHKSDSSLGAISKRLKVPRSAAQTIVRKYKHHGTTQPSYCSGKRRVLSPRDEHAKSANQSQNNSKGTCEDAGGNK